MPCSKWNFVVPFVQTMYRLTQQSECIIVFLAEMDQKNETNSGHIHEVLSDAMFTLVTLEKHFSSESPVVRRSLVKEILIIQNNVLQVQILIKNIYRDLVDSSENDGNDLAAQLWSVMYIVLGKMISETYKFCQTLRSPKPNHGAVNSVP